MNFVFEVDENRVNNLRGKRNHDTEVPREKLEIRRALQSGDKFFRFSLIKRMSIDDFAEWSNRMQCLFLLQRKLLFFLHICTHERPSHITPCPSYDPLLSLPVAVMNMNQSLLMPVYIGRYRQTCMNQSDFSLAVVVNMTREGGEF